MLLLWVLVLGVCDVALCMEGPRGKVTREMCSKPSSQVPEEQWPYCCEGYGKHCEDFAASCYLDCQPVVNSGHDVTLVEERPGFCCALYNFCCAREFSRIGDLQKVQIEERFPIFHRFHGPGKQSPSIPPPPRKNVIKQDIKNDISEISNTVNRIGRPRVSSRNNEPREQLDRSDSNSAKSLEGADDNISLGVSRSARQHKGFNRKVNVAKPQRNPVRLPHRPQNDNTNEKATPTSPRLPASNFGQLRTSNEQSIQSDDSFRKITPKKKTETPAKNTDNIEERKNINENSQQLNIEAENRKITINRAAVSQVEKQSKTNPSAEVDADENQEKPTPTKQFKRVSIPIINKRQPEIKTENNSNDKQVKEEESTNDTTEQSTTPRPNNGRKIKLGKRVLVRTAPTKNSNNEQENLKSSDSSQNNKEVKPITSRRPIISNRQIGSKKKGNTEQETLKSSDSSQNNQEVNPIASRRTIISNRQTGSKKIDNNEQETLKSNNPVQSNQEVKPVAGRRTVIRNRPGSKKISNNEQETLKSSDSVQNNQEVKPTAGRRTVIRNRPTVSKKSDNNEEEILKFSDSVQNVQEVKPVSSRRTIIRNRQTGSKKTGSNEQEILKSIESVQNNQEVKPIASRRTIIRNRPTVSKKSENNAPEILKSSDSVQNNQEVKPIASRRTVIRNRPTVSKKSENNAPEILKSSDSVQNNQEVKPIASRRTVISNRQTGLKKTGSNEQEILKSIDSVQNIQEVKPITSRRTVISNRQTGSRRSRPTAPNTNESTRLEKNQEESTASRRTGDRNNGRRIKQTVRRVIPGRTTQDSVKLSPITIKEQQKVESPRRIVTSNKPTVDKSVVLASDLEKENVKLKTPQNSKVNVTSDVLTDNVNTTESITLLPLSLGAKAPKLDLDLNTTQISEDTKIDKTKLKISTEEKEKSKDKTETAPLPQDINEHIQKIVREMTEKNLKQLNKVKENQEESENSPSSSNSPRQVRTRTRVSVPIDVDNSRNAAASVTAANNVITNSRTRSRNSRTRNQESNLQTETPTSTSTNRGTSRSGRVQSFGRRDDSTTPVKNVPENSETTERRTTRRRGRQST